MNGFDAKKLIDRLRVKKADVCPLCKAKKWLVDDSVVHRINTFEAGMSLLVVTLECENCSNMIFINPVSTGIVDAGQYTITTREKR